MSGSVSLHAHRHKIFNPEFICSSYPIDMSLAVILMFIVMGWFISNSLLFSVRDAGRKVREEVKSDEEQRACESIFFPPFMPLVHRRFAHRRGGDFGTRK